MRYNKDKSWIIWIMECLLIEDIFQFGVQTHHTIQEEKALHHCTDDSWNYNETATQSLQLQDIYKLFSNLWCYKTSLIARFYFKNSNINSSFLFTFSLILAIIPSVSNCWWILKIGKDYITINPNILTWNSFLIKLHFWMDCGTLPLWMDMS